MSQRSRIKKVKRLPSRKICLKIDIMERHNIIVNNHERACADHLSYLTRMYLQCLALYNLYKLLITPLKKHSGLIDAKSVSDSKPLAPAMTFVI